MEFLNQELYKGQKIVEQIIENKKLFIITRDKSTGRYVLWQDNKKIATNKSPVELGERCK